MHISKLSLVNYRNFARTSLVFEKGVNTVIGENGAGKTNIFRAMRLLLDGNMLRAAHKLEDSDFHRGLDQWQGHWIIISLEFDEIGPDEEMQALFLHGTGVVATSSVDRATYNLIFRPKKDVRLRLASLADGDMAGLATLRAKITIDDYETFFTGRSNVDFTDKQVYQEIVGDFDNCVFAEEVDDPRIGTRVPVYLSVAKEVSFTYIQALRDVVAEFHGSRTNPLLNLLKSKSGEIAESTMAPIVAQVKALNTSIEALEDVQAVRCNIRDTLKDAAGETYSPATLSIRSDLPDEAERLFQSLRLFVGESDEEHEGAIHEMSLGGANLIYLTLKLLEFKYQKERSSIANFLVIEEPEAHIHTHIQKTLFDRIAYADTQIIYSTHSTQISEVCNIKSMNILGRHGRSCEAYQPAAGLSDPETQAVQRYLDAVRSNLLFAKSVILVEGDAEEILIPAMFKKVMGLSLDELGVSLVNVRSTGFKNLATLFREGRVRKRCSIITDLDATYFDVTPVPSDSEAEVAYKKRCAASAVSGAARRADLDAFVAGNSWLSVHYAEHTFEIDFVSAGNAMVVQSLVPDVYSQSAARVSAVADLASGSKPLYGRRVLTMAANQGKGWFAILLGKYVNHQTVIPTYIYEAVLSARGALTKELIFNIYSYRVRCALASNAIPQAAADVAAARLSAFRDGDGDVATLKSSMAAAIPGDQIHAILSGVA